MLCFCCCCSWFFYMMKFAKNVVLKLFDIDTELMKTNVCLFPLMLFMGQFYQYLRKTRIQDKKKKSISLRYILYPKNKIKLFILFVVHLMRMSRRQLVNKFRYFQSFLFLLRQIRLLARKTHKRRKVNSFLKETNKVYMCALAISFIRLLQKIFVK